MKQTLIALAMLSVLKAPAFASHPFQRGDVNGDGQVLLADAILVLEFLFSGQDVSCEDAMDVNDDSSLGIDDPLYLLNFMFLNGVQPYEPFVSCGVDPTPDLLICAESPSSCLSGLLGNVPLYAQPRFAFTSVSAVTAADFDNDGIPDLVALLASEDAAEVMLGTGSGTFLPPRSISIGPTPAALAVADLDLDGNMDLVISPFFSSGMTIFHGFGDGSFGATTEVLTNPNNRAVIVLDLNGDNIPDLATANASTHQVSIALGLGNRTFAPSQAFPSGFAPRSLASGDFNGDGFVDIATANESDDSVSIFLGNGDGTLQVAVAIAVGSSPHGAIAADLNTDGNLDLLVTHEQSNDFAALLGNGDGSFSPPTFHSTGPSPGSVSIGDFDEDGILDLSIFTAGSIHVHLGTGTGDFLDGLFHDVGEVTGSLDFSPEHSVVDFDLDGHLDLVYRASAGVSFGRGDGTFIAPTSYSAGSAIVSAFAVADFNEDGMIDVVTASPNANDLNVLLATNHGVFASPEALPYSQDPSKLVPGDFNDDGHTDIAALDESGFGISILYGTGDGTFGTSETIPFGAQPRDLATADINNDGRDDLIVSDPASGLRILLAVPGGGLLAPQVPPLGLVPRKILLAHFDADAFVDLVTTGVNTTTVFHGAGDGSFQVSQVIDVGPNPSQPTIAGDFNSDGINDLLLDSHFLLGLGDGTFVDTGTIPFSVPPELAADFNGDGFLDLATSGGSSFTILLGDGEGGFAPPTGYTSRDCREIIPVDIDMNGSIDVLSRSSFTIRVHVRLD